MPSRKRVSPKLARKQRVSSPASMLAARMSRAPNFWVVVPAAGSARRMGAGNVPKQYLTLAGKFVIDHAVRPFIARTECQGIVVALALDDQRWRSLELASDPRTKVVHGGPQRADSVRAGLEVLRGFAESRDWILVHDAARPCLSDADLDALLTTLADDEVGGLLAAPVVDTLKRADIERRVSATVDRTALWHALTPQMFRYDTLVRALSEASVASTDESQAIEALGLKPKLVRGSAENLKITVPDDLARAEQILKARGVR
jgi:2-C-methyl-D-erythritol 4-phosphate cytidylyltransferase